MKKSKSEFEEEYIVELGITKAEYDIGFVTLYCNCGSDYCTGWAAVDNNQIDINTHILFVR